jgi:hypothetical protein
MEGSGQLHAPASLPRLPVPLERRLSRSERGAHVGSRTSVVQLVCRPSLRIYPGVRVACLMSMPRCGIRTATNGLILETNRQFVIVLLTRTGLFVCLFVGFQADSTMLFIQIVNTSWN